MHPDPTLLTHLLPRPPAMSTAPSPTLTVYSWDCQESLDEVFAALYNLIDLRCLRGASEGESAEAGNRATGSYGYDKLHVQGAVLC